MVGVLQAVAEGDLREQEWAMLIGRAAAGDQMALGELYDETSRLVYGLALRILGDPVEAEEVSLGVYEQVWRQAAGYDAQRGRPLVWLMMLTRSRAIDRWRALGRQRQRQEPLDSTLTFLSPLLDPEEDAITAERRRLVQAALSSLSAEQREAIELAYFEGLSQSEIAQRLQQPLGTVKTRIRLGMMKLRDRLLPLREELQS